MTKNEFTLLYTILKHGVQPFREMSAMNGLSLGYISQQMNMFRRKGWTDEKGIIDDGMEALRPYKVDNAVIMAAGLSTRFVPLSLEKPKGLLEVKGEVLIERQIRQLKSAGIDEIILVLGYKKEAFFYLENKYEGLHIVINTAYNLKNNPYTLYCARGFLGNSYICSSDDYFVENPFEDYVYSSYYSGVRVSEHTDEWYMISDSKGNIAGVQTGGRDGTIMLGHAYWNREFSAAMLKLISDDQSTGYYDQVLWEKILADNLKKLPPMSIRVYPPEIIFEFDSLDDLRRFDIRYIYDTHSRIMSNITQSLKCEQSDILNFRSIKEGLTNTSFVFEVKGQQYVYRHPGEGTEKIISRSHEKKALTMAREIGADPTFICMDENEGWKLSYFVPDIRVPYYKNHEDSLRVISVMQKLHRRALHAEWAFLPWEEALRIETILREQKGGIADRDFDDLKAAVKLCCDRTSGDGVEMCFCHCDTYAPNWMLTPDGRTILIDWEYAGEADPGCDVGTYIMDSLWTVDEADVFIRDYCAEDYDDHLRFHYLAYTAIVSYYWYVWALYREYCGAVMGESLYNWRTMAKKYSEYLVKAYSLS